jgi:hypothetical protein
VRRLPVAYSVLVALFSCRRNRCLLHSQRLPLLWRVGDPVKRSLNVDACSSIPADDDTEGLETLASSRAVDEICRVARPDRSHGQ